MWKKADWAIINAEKVKARKMKGSMQKRGVWRADSGDEEVEKKNKEGKLDVEEHPAKQLV